MSRINIKDAAINLLDRANALLRPRQDTRDKQDALEKKFLQAAEQSNIPEIVRCLNGGVNPNCRNLDDGFTALHLAAERGDLQLAQKLLSYSKTMVDSRDFLGATPLYIACGRENLTLVRYLLRNGADSNARTRFDTTPLHSAVRRSNIAVIQLLFKYGAQPNIIDSMNNTPLHLAILEKWSLPMVKLLCGNGADPNLDIGDLPLFLECVLSCHKEEEMEIVLYLVRLGVDVNVTDKIANRNALHYVALTGYLPLANKLLQMGCNPYKTDHYGKTPIDIAKTHDNDV
ncbi:hypothetical protein ILUMI_10827, partial [Ignelater luminosus]